MFAHSLDVRFAAVRVLQGLLARYRPGSRRYDQIEHAIDLALNESRVADDYLVRNVLRDAQRIQDRFSSAHPSVPLTNDSPNNLNVIDPGERFEQLADCESPELLAIVGSEVRAILKKVEGPPPIVSRVWEGMLSGETVAELAAATGFSKSYISKIRMALTASAKCRLAVVEA